MLDKSKFETVKAEEVATVSYTDDNAFFAGTDIPKKDIIEVFKYAGEFVSNAAKVSKEHAKELMEKDKSINKVITHMPYGTSKRSSVETEIKRKHTYPGMNGGEPTTKSTMKIKVTDAVTKVSKSSIREMEADLTSAICK